MLNHKVQSLKSHPEIQMRLATLRDPDGMLFNIDGRWIRGVLPSGIAAVERFEPELRALISEGLFVGTEKLSKTEGAQLLESAGTSATPFVAFFEHEAVSFPTYPFEWSSSMLYDAGVLTLKIAQRIAKSGLGLKDATPMNVLFRNGKPVFVDLLSVEIRDPRDSFWLAWGQFFRNFVNPLIAKRYFGFDLAPTFLSNRDGLTPEQLYSACGFFKRFHPKIFPYVTLPAWLGNRGTKQHSPRALRQGGDPAKAAFIYNGMLRHLENTLQRFRSDHYKRSQWSEYMGADLPYSHKAFQEKERIVTEFLTETKPSSLLDVGCNNGHFSAIAAKQGASVVAIDLDPTVVDFTYKRARDADLKITPLCVNLARPSPGTGWDNSETTSFLERSKNKFDTVMMLAVIHHLMVTEGIPPERIATTVSQISRKHLILEYIDPKDETFQGLLKGRDHLYQHIDLDFVTKIFSKHFAIVHTLTLETHPTRTLMLLQKR